MSTNDHYARAFRETRDSVRSLQFFVAAMAAQLRDLHDKLEQAVATPVASNPSRSPANTPKGAETPPNSLASLGDLEQAQAEVATLRTRVDELERHNANLQQDLERQHVTFADHHAAKQEIARLRTELDAAQGEETNDTPDDGPGLRKRWSLGK